MASAYDLRALVSETGIDLDYALARQQRLDLEEQRIEYRIASAGKRQRWYTSCKHFFSGDLSLYVRYKSLAGITPAWSVNAFPSPVSRIYGLFCPHVAEVVVLTTV